MLIKGLGSATPERVITNDDLASFLDTSDEWISLRTGIRSRRVMTGEQLEEFAAIAAQNALTQAGMAAADIDFIICSNVYNSYITPGLGCIVQPLIGTSCASIDINGACAGFPYALEMAQAYLKAGSYQNILIICAESMTRMADWTDRSSCVLFGDAAAAVIVTTGGEDAHFIMSNTPSTELLFAQNPAGNCPYITRAPSARALTMNGQEVYKYAVSRSTADILALTAKAGIAQSDIAHYVLHQANLRIVEAVRTRLKQPKEKFPTNIERYGNTSSASVPLLLDELNRAGVLQEGEYIALSAFGAGLTAGACLLRWASKG